MIINEELKFSICIENKVWAPLAEHQLGKYYDIVENYGFDLKLYVFLTPFPSSIIPDFETIYENKTYSDINKLLDFTLKNAIIQEQYKFIIENYMSSVNRHILGESDSIKLAQNIYHKHKEAIDFIWNNRPDFISIKNQISEYFSQRNDKYVNYTIEKDKYYVRFLPKAVVEKFKYDFYSWGEPTNVMFVVGLIFEDNKIWVKFCFGAIYNSEKADELQKIKDDVFTKMHSFKSLKGFRTSNKSKSTSQYPSVANFDLIINTEDIVNKSSSLIEAFKHKFIQFEHDILDKWTEEVLINL